MPGAAAHPAKGVAPAYAVAILHRPSRVQAWVHAAEYLRAQAFVSVGRPCIHAQTGSTGMSCPRPAPRISTWQVQGQASSAPIKGWKDNRASSTTARPATMPSALAKNVAVACVLGGTLHSTLAVLGALSCETIYTR